MSDGRRAGRITIEEADRLLARFVRNVNLSRRGARDKPPPSTPPAIVVSKASPRRRSDEKTRPFEAPKQDTGLSRVRRRRLLGFNDGGGDTLDATKRRGMLIELAALYRHGHIDDVVAEVERFRSRFPFDVELHAALVEFFLERGDRARSIDLLYGMVDAHFERRDASAARKCLERVRELDPENRRLARFDKLLSRT